MTAKTVALALDSLNNLLVSGAVNWYYWKKPGKTAKKKSV
jgi:hypothetical protein